METKNFRNRGEGLSKRKTITPGGGRGTWERWVHDNQGHRPTFRSLKGRRFPREYNERAITVHRFERVVHRSGCRSTTCARMNNQDRVKVLIISVPTNQSAMEWCSLAISRLKWRFWFLKLDEEIIDLTESYERLTMGFGFWIFDRIFRLTNYKRLNDLTVLTLD